MIVILKKNPDKAQLDSLKAWLNAKGIDIHESAGVHETVLGLVGDTATIDINLIKALDAAMAVGRSIPASTASSAVRRSSSMSLRNSGASNPA